MTIAVLAALVVIVLLSMLSTDGPARMSYAGMADVALGFATSALTAFHAAHLIHHRNHASAGGG